VESKAAERIVSLLLQFARGDYPNRGMNVVVQLEGRLKGVMKCCVP